eukprot:917200-Prymnesium_polylepis.1
MVERPLEVVLRDVAEGAPVWLSFANSAVADLAINWAMHVAGLGLISSAVIAALDGPLLARLLNASVPTFRHFAEGLESDVRSSRTGFRRLGIIKAELVIRVLAARRQ